MQSEVQLALPFSLRTPQTPKKNLFSRIFSSSSRSSGTVEGRDEEMELPTIETPSGFDTYGKSEPKKVEQVERVEKVEPDIQGPGLSN